MARKQVLVIPFYHCDIVWRRPPETQVAIRAAQYSRALDMLAAHPEFRFEFDQAILVREYLAAHPERREQMRQFVADGQLDITGGEESIPDLNLIMGESLVRNVLLGRLWFAEELGAEPVVASFDDAFGQPAQLPQVLAGFGYRGYRDTRTPGLDREAARRGVWWEGLDGSRIFYLPAHGSLTEYTHVCNLPVVYGPRERLDAALSEVLATEAPVVYCCYGSEEDLVEEHILARVNSFPVPRGVDLRFGLARDAFALAQADAAGLPEYRGEMNPTLQGTHITRIRLKQAYRRAEWGLLTAEVAATGAALRGQSFPAKRFRDLWRKLCYVQFHDSICGCHTDEVNRRVMGYCRNVTRDAGRLATGAVSRRSGSGEPSHGTAGMLPAITLFNPLPYARREPVALDLPAGRTVSGPDGQPLAVERCGEAAVVVTDLPPLGTVSLPLVKAPAGRVRTISGKQVADKVREIGPYAVTVRDDGVTLRHRAWDRELVSGRFPEVRFRQEDGCLWEERFLGPVYGEEMGTAALVDCQEGPVSVRFRWQGEIVGDPRQGDPLPPHWLAREAARPPVYADLQRLTWEKELVFYRELERIEATVRLDWRGCNTEIIIGFPLRLDLRHSRPRYEVPFGSQERRPYFELPSGSPEIAGAPVHLAALGGKGAYPALTWVAYGDQDWGMVLANRGTPSHRLMDGTIEVAVLRSPTLIASGFHPPKSAWENGRHTFEFALTPYAGDPVRGGACRLGPAFNAPPLTAPGQASGYQAESLLSLDAPGVAFSCLKPAERRPGYILRTFETAGQAARGRVRTGLSVKHSYETDLKEEPQREAKLTDLRWRPYEIKTLLLETE